MLLRKMLLQKVGRSILLISASLWLATVSYAEQVTDIAGRTVELPKQVNRILLGEGRLFHAIALLEGDKPLARIAGWQGDFRRLDQQNYAAYRAKFPEIDRIPLIGNTTADSISAEKVLTLQPDIAVFGLSGHGPGKDSELVKQLEKSGIPVIFVDFRTAPMTNTIPSMRLLGKALQREVQAERYITFYQQQLERVTKITQTIPTDQQRKVFIELKAGTGEECCGTAGDGNMGNFIDIAGGINIAKHLLPSSLGTVNLEKVLASDPDVYIASGGQAPNSKAPGLKLGAQVTVDQAWASIAPVLTRTGISSLRAVKQGDTHALWHSYYNSPYNILAIQLFAKWIYPERYTDLDPKQTMDELYQEFLVIEPSGTFWLNSLSDKSADK